MAFGNNFLQDADAAEFDSTHPRRTAPKGFFASSARSWRTIDSSGVSLTKRTGSSLTALDGGVWYVHRLADDGDPDQPFPQVVSLRIGWLQREWNC
jgi:hypothetical protein